MSALPWWALAGLVLALFAGWSTALTGGVGRFRAQVSPMAHYARRLGALVLLGALPAGWVNAQPGGWAGLGLGLPEPMRVLGALALLVPVAMAVAWRASAGEDVQAEYPQIRRETWGHFAMDANLVTWALYLVGYEITFRGLLLFPAIESLGLAPALLLNVALYVAAHADKHRREMLACVPMGLLFAGLVLWTVSLWTAVGLHIAIAWTAEIGSVHHRTSPRTGNS